LDHRFRHARVCDVAKDRNGAHAGLGALGRHRLELVPVDARIQRKVRALGGERQRDGAPDVAAGAGDQRSLALEPHAGSLLWAGSILVAPGGSNYKPPWSAKQAMAGRVRLVTTD